MNEVEVYQVLASKSRLEILRLLYRKPFSVEELSKATGLRPITVRHHLQLLEETGFVESYEERTGGIGRPKVYYKVAKQPPLIGFPKRQYLMLCSLLIDGMRSELGLSRTKTLFKEVGLELTESILKKLALENGVSNWSLKEFRELLVGKYLKEFGAEPEIVKADDRKTVYRVYNCVFLELAKEVPEIICEALHEGFNEGVSKVTNGRLRIRKLSCMGKGDPYCEYVCELLGETEGSPKTKFSPLLV